VAVVPPVVVVPPVGGELPPQAVKAKSGQTLRAKPWQSPQRALSSSGNCDCDA
jgi:hypothetical protein